MIAREKDMYARRTIAYAFAASIGGLLQSVTFAGTIPYINDFNSSSLANATAEFTLDAGNSVLNYSAGGGTVVSTASEPVTNLSGSDFVVSTQFKLNAATGSGNLPTMGLGILGSSTTFLSTGGDSYYLADWGISSTLSAAGQLRILAQGNTTNFAGVSGDSDGAGANGSSVLVGNTYELRLTGTYIGGTLNMTFAMFDALGSQLGTAATASDSTPLGGQFFGYRNRTAGANHNVGVGYDNFRVIPEPATITTLAVYVIVMTALRQRSLRSTN
jgi:hypothetical protein